MNKYEVLAETLKEITENPVVQRILINEDGTLTHLPMKCIPVSEKIKNMWSKVNDN